MPLSSASEGASSVAKASALASASGIVADLRFARNVDGVSVPERVCTRARRVRVAVSVVVVDGDAVTKGRRCRHGVSVGVAAAVKHSSHSTHKRQSLR